jgi:hypothetical protein
VLKTDLHELEDTAARGVLAPFQQAVSKLHAEVPAVNADLQQSSRVLGDIADHTLNAAVGGLHTFTPALLQIEGGVDRLAARFEAWATGPGGEKFAQALITDFEHVEPLLDHLSSAIAHVIAGANTPGLGIIDELDDLAQVLDAIPVPVLTAVTTSIVGLKIAGLVSGLVGKLAVSVDTLAVSESRAAAAGAGLQSRLGATVGVLGRVAGAWVGLSVATDTATNATSGWQSSSNDIKRFFGTFTTGLNDVAHLNFKGAFSDLFGKNADEAAKAAGYVKALHSSLDDMWKSLSEHQDATIFTGSSAVLPGHGSVAGAAGSGAAQQGLTVEQQIQKSYALTVDKTTEAINRQRLALVTLAGHQTISQLQTAYGSSATALQKNIDATEKFLKVGGEQVDVYKGVTVTSGMYQVALAKTGGNLEAATGYIEAQIDSLGTQKTALAGVSAQQQRLGTFVSDMAAKYKLTGAQVDLYTEAMGLNTTAIAASNSGLRDAEAQFGDLVRSISNGDTALNGWIAAVDQWSKSADTAADRAALIGEALRAANGDTLTYSNTMVGASVANQQLVTDFVNLKKGVLDLKTGTIDYHNAAAAPLLGDLQNLQTAAMNAAAATYQHFNAIGDDTAATKAFKVYVNDTRGALIDQATQLGLTIPQAKRLADQYFGIKNSGDLKKQIQLIGQDKVLTALHGILEDLDYLAGKQINFYIKGVMTVPAVEGAHGTGGRVPVTAADGAIITAGTGPRADDVLIRVSKGEAVIPADQVAKHRSLVQAMISRTQGFASGGFPGESGGFTGVDYSGNANKYGSTSSGSSSKNNVEYVVAGQRYASLRAAENAAARAFKANVKLGVTIDDKDLRSFKASLSGTVEQAHTAFVKINQDLRQLGASKTLRVNLANENKDLDKVIADRNKAVDRLKDVTDKWTQVRDSVYQAGTGSFDVATAGAGFDGQQPVTFANIQAQQTQAKNLVTKWAAGIRSLARVFGKTATGRGMLQRLAADGPSDYPEVQALLAAGSKNLTDLAATQYQINKTSSDLGTFVGNQLYGSQISNLKSEIKLDDRSIDRMANRIQTAVERATARLADRPVEIKVDGKTIARVTAAGTKKAKR